jgi:hypothetical protein
MTTLLIKQKVKKLKIVKPLSFEKFNFCFKFKLLLEMSAPPARKKTYFKMKDESLIILTKWLNDHYINPYASRANKIELAQKTNLSIDQVTSWLNEARKKKKKATEKASIGISQQKDC